MSDTSRAAEPRFRIGYETDDPDSPSPLLEIFRDFDGPSPRRDDFLEQVKPLFDENAQSGQNLFLDGPSARPEVEVPVRGTYVAIAQNLRGALFASDIAMSGIRPRAVLEEIPTTIEPPEFRLVGYTVMPNLWNLLVVHAEPYPATFAVKTGDRAIRVHDRDGVQDVPIRWLSF